MKIGTRLVLGFGVCLLFLLMLGGFGIYELKEFASRSNTLIGTEAELVSNTHGAQSDLNTMRRYEKEAFIYTPDMAKVDESATKWGEALDSLNQNIELLKKLEQDPAHQETLANISKALTVYEAGFGKVLSQIKTGAIVSTVAGNTAMREFEDPVKQAETLLVKFAVAGDEEIDKSITEMESNEQRAIVLSMAIVAATFIVMLIMVILLIRSIRGPLAQIQRLVDDMSEGEGDLTNRLSYNGNDELGAICGSFNLFIDKLRGIICQVAQSAVQVASASNQLHSTAEQIATGSEQVASQTGTVAAASEEMSATSSDIAKNCLWPAENSNRASEMARGAPTWSSRPSMAWNS